MDTKTAVTALAALAQESRLAIFRLLVQRYPGAANPGDIAATLGLPGNTLSFHLKSLAHAGLVASETEGRFVHYRARIDAMQGLVGFLTENCCGRGTGSCAPECAPADRGREPGAA